jgi:YHS domain-containing protein
MVKKTFMVVSVAFFSFVFAGVALACGGCGGSCGEGCGGGCSGGAAASSCQGAAEVCGDSSASSVGAKSSMKAVNVGNTICPVMGQKINDKTKVVYEYAGKAYNLCCAGCVNEFNKDPQKYAMKVNQLNNK